MRKSRNTTGYRSLRAGVAVTATAAVVVAGTALPAYAATITPSSPTVPTQGGLTLSLSGVDADNAFDDDLSAAFAVRFVGGATAACGSAVPTVAPSATPPVVDGGDLTRVDDDNATIVTPALSAGVWKLCVYRTTNTPAVLVHSTAGTVTAVVFGRLNQQSGPAVGGNNITLNGPENAFAASPTVAALFNSTTPTCPLTYGTVAATAGAASTAATTTTKTNAQTITIKVPTNLAPATSYGVCVYGSASGTSPLLARADMPYSVYAATLPAITAAPTGGAEGKGNVVVSTTTANTFVAAPFIKFSRGACAGTYGATVGTSSPATRISGTKVAVPVPTAVLVNGADATTPWHICAFSDSDASGGATSGDTLLTAPALYSVAPELDLTNVAAADLTPSSAPAQGGTFVTISDLRGIPTAPGASVSASLGGSPMTDIKVNGPRSISGYVAASAPGMVDLRVTTAAGTQTASDVFEYSYGISVTPNTAEPEAEVVLDVMGAGFADPDLTWATSAEDFATTDPGNADDPLARVILTDNAWNNQAALTTVDGNATGISAFALAAPPVAQCGDILVIGDNELICTMDLGESLAIADAGTPTPSDITDDDVTAAATPVDPGTYTVTVINTGAATSLEFDSYNVSVPSSGSTFTVADF